MSEKMCEFLGEFRGFEPLKAFWNFRQAVNSAVNSFEFSSFCVNFRRQLALKLQGLVILSKLLFKRRKRQDLSQLKERFYLIVQSQSNYAPQGISVSTALPFTYTHKNRTVNFENQAWRFLPNFWYIFFESKDKRDFETILKYIRDWLQNKEKTMRFYDMSVGIRSVHLALAFELLGNFSVNFRLKFTLFRAILVHFNELLNERKFTDGNHALWQIVGLGFMSRALAYKNGILYAQNKILFLTNKNFTPTGVNLENSPFYHDYNVNLLQKVLGLKIFDAIEGKLRCIVQRGGGVLRYLCDNEGYFAQIADSEYKKRNINKNLSPKLDCKDLKEGGYQVAQNENFYFLFHAPKTLIHAHCDYLSFILHYKNIKIFTDSGVYDYNYGALHKHFMSDKAHNMLNFKEQTFSVNDIDFTHLWLNPMQNDENKASFEGFYRHEKFTWHRLLSLNVRDKEFILRDIFSVFEKLSPQISFILGLDISVNERKKGELCLSHKNEAVALLLFDENCSYAVEKTPISFKFGTKVDSLKLSFTPISNEFCLKVKFLEPNPNGKENSVNLNGNFVNFNENSTNSKENSVNLQQNSAISRSKKPLLIAARNDGLGARLMPIMHAMVLARLCDFDFGFTWDNASWDQSLKSHKSVNLSGICTGQIHDVFDENFIKAHSYTGLYEANSGIMQKMSFADFKNKFTQDFGHFISQHSARLVLDDENILYKHLYPVIFKEIGFTQQNRALLNQAGEAIKAHFKQEKFISIHIRNGDMIFNLPFILYRDYFKAMPIEIALELIENALNAQQNVLLLSDNFSLLKALKERYKVAIASDFVPQNLNDLQRLFFEIGLMVASSKIYAAHSTFARIASYAGYGDEPEFCFEAFEPQVFYDIISKRLHSLSTDDKDKAFSLFCLYRIGCKLNVPKDALFDYLARAHQFDKSNPTYTILMVDFALRNKNFKEANELLQRMNFDANFFKCLFQDALFRAAKGPILSLPAEALAFEKLALYHKKACERK